MTNSISRCLVLFCGLATICAADYQWPLQPYDALEDFIYEGARPDGSSMGNLVRPCKLRSGTNTTVAAEWVRLVYHDTATHNVSDGTGGLDGSIFFETNRDENSGMGMNNTLSDLSAFPSKHISRADVIAIAAVWSVATCGGPIIPLRGGRIDANVAGPYGVPNASDPIESLTSNFAKQGFNVSEMIQLVACGHTLGGVRSTDFPTVVPPAADPTKAVFDLFDNTQQFDNVIVTQYLQSTTLDPLVVMNQSMASDLRVFGSDGNVTMRSMSTAESFAQTCTTIFDKMLNTVPSTVTLTDEINLQSVKVSNVQLTVADTELQFQASVRLQLSSNTTNVKMYWCDRYGPAADCNGGLKRFAAPGGSATVSSPTSEAMGVSLKKYQFVVPINATQSISKFWFMIDYGNGTIITADNNGANYVVSQDDVLWVPTMSKAQSVLTGQIGWYIVAAVKSTNTPERVYIDCFGRATSNYIAVNATYNLALNNSLPARAGYNFYSGTATDEFGVTMQFDLYSVAANGTAQVDADRQATLIGVALADESTVNSTTSGTLGGAAGASSTRRLGRAEARWGVGAALGVAGVWTLSRFI
ncbi:L-ascorbate oxidase [Mycena pura]|uniref:Peroxidase n=1 Tax=Mycena pura TaxID=153505 RepID=A0AAD6YDE3_9AGAR|nr:L-ascorbate oxidase [Mycena pura]